MFKEKRQVRSKTFPQCGVGVITLAREIRTTTGKEHKLIVVSWPNARMVSSHVVPHQPWMTDWQLEIVPDEAT